MLGRNRLPGGEVQKASQKRARPAETRTIRIEIPWRARDKVRWRDRTGIYKRDDDEENGFVEIGGRLHRVARRELEQG